MLKELLLATIVSTSLSVRTPNDVEKKLDYEFSVKIENTNKNFQYLLKRDWERELGEKYIDDVFKFSHTVNDFIYYGVDYVNKESKDIFYTTYNIGIDDNGWIPCLNFPAVVFFVVEPRITVFFRNVIFFAKPDGP